MKKANKYNVAPKEERTWTGHWHWQRQLQFDSKGEMIRFDELLILEISGTIKGLQLQPKFVTRPSYTATNGQVIAPEFYVGDFFYYENEKPVCEDFKGRKTRVYISKIKKAKAMHPDIEFREVY